jgi:hypothetical protein
MTATEMRNYSVAPEARDNRPVNCVLYDLMDRKCGSLELTPRAPGDAPRVVVFRGRKFAEQDGTGYYSLGTFVEVAA